MINGISIWFVPMWCHLSLDVESTYKKIGKATIRESRREVKRDRISRIGHDRHLAAFGQLQLYLRNSLNSSTCGLNH